MDPTCPALLHRHTAAIVDIPIGDTVTVLRSDSHAVATSLDAMPDSPLSLRLAVSMGDLRAGDINEDYPLELHLVQGGHLTESTRVWLAPSTGTAHLTVGLTVGPWRIDVVNPQGSQAAKFVDITAAIIAADLPESMQYEAGCRDTGGTINFETPGFCFSPTADTSIVVANGSTDGTYTLTAWAYLPTIYGGPAMGEIGKISVLADTAEALVPKYAPWLVVRGRFDASPTPVSPSAVVTVAR